MNIKSSVRIIHRMCSCVRFLLNLPKCKDTLNKHNCLEPGRYLIVKVSKRTYVFKSDTPVSFLKMIHYDKKNKWFQPKIIVKGLERKDLYAQVALGSSDGAFRYFNYKKGYSFRFFNSGVMAQTYRDAYRNFSTCFKTPIITISDTYFKEKLVNYIPRAEWNVDDVKNRFVIVIGDYINYIDNLKANSKSIVNNRDYNVSLIRTKSEDFEGLYYRLVELAEGISVSKLFFCHSDLHFGNTLFTEQEWYLIDVENARFELFFYDFFNVIFVEYNDVHCSYLLDCYLKNESWLMDLLEKMFIAAGESFLSKYRMKYFYTFLLYRLLYYSDYATKRFEKNQQCCQISRYIKRTQRVLDYINSYVIS